MVCPTVYGRVYAMKVDRPRAHFVLPLLAVFIVFHTRAVRVYFTADDAMNWYGYWQPPVWKVILANIFFWSKFVRPMGALYYLPLHALFGANPVPFNIIRLLLLL